MRGEREALPRELRTAEAIDEALGRLLPEVDPFWPRWLITRHREGAL